MPNDPAEPWRSFLVDLDALVEHEVQLHCCGGFVVTALHGLARTTADLDVLAVLPHAEQRVLAAVAGRGSKLHETHGIYLDIVTVATHPDSYEERLTEMYPGTFRHLRLFALDPYDLVLTKLTRNADRDRSDLEYLATAVPLDTNVLRERYHNEMRSYLGVPAREDLTLELWIEIAREAQLRNGNTGNQLG
jgi:Nucleotidyltransferase of unknown function (DUF6036)